ncbi:hypothetical protein OIU84_023882 [Salix udensis]|uniref:Pentatricopeptide repeat-containing protein n=1 Tax=Salix udensis TaxID=889485 RepID=A0AAD6PHH6_9ROSI|nr:hypothetical protein OIU84_023882 [Salix udensis]
MSTYTQHHLPPISLPFSSSPSLPSHQQSTKPPIHSSSPKPISISHSQASWIESLRSKSRSNLFREAITTYIEMIGSGVSPDNFAFPAVLKAVAGTQELYLGKQIHAHVFKFGYGSFSSVTIDNTLVNMYEWEVAIKAFRMMLMEGLEPSSFTLVSMALACSNLRKCDGLWLGKQIHGCCFRKGHWRTFSNNALMAMYAKLGRLDDAKSLLVLFEDRDLVTWNSMISSFSQNERFVEALMFLRLMVLEGVKPDGVTFASVLPACSHLELLRTGKEIHAHALRADNLIENSFVGSALVDMYCNCGQVESGRLVFDGVLDRKIGLWNAMITGYAQSEQDEKALMLFIGMEASAGLYPNATTMSSIVPAYVRCEGISRKEGIHGYVIKRGLETHRYVQNALIDMYSRMGDIRTSQRIFDSMEDRDIVSWNTIITSYVICGRSSDALLLLHEMQRIEEKSTHDGDYNDEKQSFPVVLPYQL